MKKFFLSSIVAVCFLTNGAEVISTNNTGEFNNANSYSPRLSYDGNIVSFVSRNYSRTTPSKLTGVVNRDLYNLYIHQRNTGLTRHIAMPPIGEMWTKLFQAETSYSGELFIIGRTKQKKGRSVSFEDYLVNINKLSHKNLTKKIPKGGKVRFSGDGQNITSNSRLLSWSINGSPVPDNLCGVIHRAKDFGSGAWFYSKNEKLLVEEVPFDSGKKCSQSGGIEKIEVLNRGSKFPMVNSDGSIKVFVSSATNIGSINTYPYPSDRVFVWSGGSNYLEIFGAKGHSTSITDATISGDGSKVAIARMTTLKSGNSYRRVNYISVIDTALRTYQDISISVMDADRNPSLRLSHDGRFLVFTSKYKNYHTSGPLKGQFKHHTNNVLYVFDTKDEKYEIVSKNKAGKVSSINSSIYGEHAISGDGNIIVFGSNDKSLIQDSQRDKANHYLQVMLVNNPLM